MIGVRHFYTDNMESVRELRLSFDRKSLGDWFGTDLDPGKAGNPELMFHDNRFCRSEPLHADVHPAGTSGVPDGGEVTRGQRLRPAKSTGDPSVNADPASLARYIATVIYGIAVLRRGFATPAERVDRPVLGRRLVWG
jgi:hypothetical protein